MKLYAHIVDAEGRTNGAQGYVQDFATLAETDDEFNALSEAMVHPLGRTTEDLEALVGPEIWPFYVLAPNAHCAGWRYEHGAFIDPSAA